MMLDNIISEGVNVQKTSKAPARAGLAKGMMGKIGGEHQDCDAQLESAPVALMPAEWSMLVHCRAKLCRNEEGVVSVPTVYQPLPVSSADAVLQEDMVPSVRPCSPESDVTVGADEKLYEKSGVEWLPGMTEQFSDFHDPFRKAIVIRGSYATGGRTGRRIIHDTTSLRPVV